MSGGQSEEPGAGGEVAAGAEGGLVRDDDAIDFAARELCPDGACTGVLGEDGRCRVCGRAGPTTGPGGDDLPEPAAADGEPLPPAPASAPGPAAGSREVGEADDLDLAARELCADGACTGVLGEDGRCRVCGRAPAEVPTA